MLEEYCFECNSVTACLTVWLAFLFIGLNNVYYMFHACRMDEFFTLYVHHGRYFNENPKEYVRGDVGVVDDCDPDKWFFKVKIEAICKEFGYTFANRLWYKMPGDNEGRMFHRLMMI